MGLSSKRLVAVVFLGGILVGCSPPKLKKIDLDCGSTARIVGQVHTTCPGRVEVQGFDYSCICESTRPPR